MRFIEELAGSLFPGISNTNNDQYRHSQKHTLTRLRVDPNVPSESLNNHFIDEQTHFIQAARSRKYFTIYSKFLIFAKNFKS